jgi:hypothetical protein
MTLTKQSPELMLMAHKEVIIVVEVMANTEVEETDSKEAEAKGHVEVVEIVVAITGGRNHDNLTKMLKLLS